MRSGMRSWSKCVIFSRRMKSSSSVGPRSPAFSEFWLSAMATPWLVRQHLAAAIGAHAVERADRGVRAQWRSACAGLGRRVGFAQGAGGDRRRRGLGPQARRWADGVGAAELQRFVGVPRHGRDHRLRVCRLLCQRLGAGFWRRTPVTGAAARAILGRDGRRRGLDEFLHGSSLASGSLHRSAGGRRTTLETGLRSICFSLDVRRRAAHVMVRRPAAAL